MCELFNAFPSSTSILTLWNKPFLWNLNAWQISKIPLENIFNKYAYLNAICALTIFKISFDIFICSYIGRKMFYVLTVLSPRLTTGQCMYAIVPTWTVTLVNPLIFPNLNFSFSKSLELSSINDDLISLLLPEFRTIKERI